MRGGERKFRADPFEAMPERVFVQFAGLGRIVANAEQVVDGILILFATQAVMGNGGSCCHSRSATLFESCIKIGNELSDLLLARSRLWLRRHLATVDLLEDFTPAIRVGPHAEITRELVDTHAAELFLRTVATNAMLLKELLQGLSSIGGSIQNETQR